MKNYRLTMDIQMDSDATATVFAENVQVAMQVAAEATIDICEAPGAHLTLGYTVLTSAAEFRANATN
jgi:hypothetical protein